MIDRLADALNLTPTQSQLLLTGVWLVSLTLIRWIVLSVVHRERTDIELAYPTERVYFPGPGIADDPDFA